MSKDLLKHIFEPTACLTGRQLKTYVSGKMVHEEAHAVETHLMSCPLCSDAVEGMMEAKAHGSLTAVDSLDSSFIAKHFGVSQQEIKAATTTPPVIKAGAYSTQPEKEPRQSINIPWKPIAAAATFAAVISLGWVMRDSIFPKTVEEPVAQAEPVAKQPEEQVYTYTPPVDTTTGVDTMALAMNEPALPQQAPPVALPDMAKDQAALMQAKTLAEKKALADAAKKAETKKGLPNAAATGALAMNENRPTTAAPAVQSATQAATDRRLGNSFTGPEKMPATDETERVEAAAETKAKETVDHTKSISKRASTGMEKADEFYNKGKYKKALKIYQDEMYDSKSNKRDNATLMAAQCHMGLGETAQAKTLLNTLIDKNSHKKAQAQQLLNKLED